jgi:hypothetical protein
MPAHPFTARIIPLVVGAGVFGLLASGCVHHSYPRARIHGPVYSHVPAHVTPRNHPGVSLVFDRSLDCHVVVGHAHHYFYRNRYYRRHNGRWQVGPRLRGPWVLVDARVLPPRLGRRYAGPAAAAARVRAKQLKHEIRLLEQRRERERRLAAKQRNQRLRLEKERRALERERKRAKSRRIREQKSARAARAREQRLAQKRHNEAERLAKERRVLEQKRLKDQRQEERKLFQNRRNRDRQLAKASREKKREKAKDRRDAARQAKRDRRERFAANR